MTSADSLAAAVFADPANDLVAMARHFLDSDDRCWHIDRHVADVDQAWNPSPELVRAACAVALMLSRRWAADREGLGSSGLLISRPYVIIDDAWLDGETASPPPHVYVCLARDDASFKPVTHDMATPVRVTGNATVDALVGPDTSISRLAGAFDDEPGRAWMIGPDL